MRLIDADKLKDTLLEYDYTTEHNQIFRYINEQPTAYDIDKVVEELEDRVNEANNNCLCEMHENGHTLDFENENGRIKGLKEAIEIVKQGGVSDDVCEWKLTDTRKVMPYKTSCGNEDLYDNSYKYCPYCGKKIKVVE